MQNAARCTLPAAHTMSQYNNSELFSSFVYNASNKHTHTYTRARARALFRFIHSLKAAFRCLHET